MIRHGGHLIINGGHAIINGGHVIIHGGNIITLHQKEANKKTKKRSRVTARLVLTTEETCVYMLGCVTAAAFRG